MITILQKLKALLVCGFPKHRGNFSLYFKNGKNWIFEVGIFRAVLIGIFYKAKTGSWASHPLARILEKHKGNDGQFSS
jgi:hypothetical protein